MSTQSIIQRAFLGGELSPASGARADLIKYVFGLKTCQNFLVRRQGGVTKRPGTVFVQVVKDTARTPRLIPFLFESGDQSYAIELGVGYIRFYYHGAPVTVSSVAAYNAGTTYTIGALVASGGINYYSLQNGNLAHTPASSATFWYPFTGAIYELPNTYGANDIGRIQYAQSTDVLTLTHPSHPVRELTRFANVGGNPLWTLTDYTTAPSISAPTSVSATAGVAGSRTVSYVATAIKAETYEESYPSTAFDLGSSDTPTENAPTTVTCTDPNSPVAVEIAVYKDPTGNNDIFGFIGTSKSTTFKDTGLVPDFFKTPPIPRTLFASSLNYPSVSAYYQQRQWFAHSTSEREKIWGSQVGFYKNFSIRTPIQDDDAVTFVPAGHIISAIAFLVPMKRLVVLTDTGHYVVMGDESGAITPTTINLDPQGSIGSDYRVRPLLIGDVCLFVQGRGAAIRELSFNRDRDVYGSRDLTLYARHLFEGYTIEDQAFAQEPFATYWAIRSDSTLLGMTYIPEEDVYAWHTHTTGVAGTDGFEAVLTVPDTVAGQDTTYVVARRTIDSVETRYIERFAHQFVYGVHDVEDAVFMDAAITYDGAAATTFTGLSHLNGQRVAILGDGAVVSNGINGIAYTVSGGSVTIPAAVSKAQIGIPIRYPDIEPLDLDVQGSDLRAKKKRYQGSTLLLEGAARNFLIGPDEDHLKANRPQPWQSSTELATEPQESLMVTSWTEKGSCLIRHLDPLPFAIVGLIPNFEAGG